MQEDIRQVLISNLDLWQAKRGPGGFGLVVDREGQYYFVGYGGMGNVDYLPVSTTNPFHASIVELVNEGKLTPEVFQAVYEMDFKEVACLRLQNND